MNNIKYLSSNLSDKDIFEIADIHYNYLNTSFLSQLGSKFLFYLYKSINDCESAELIVAAKKSDGQIVGFIAGTESLKPVYIHLVKKYFFPAILSLIPHFFSLSKLKKIFETLKHSKIEEDVQQNIYPKAELLSIAITKDCQGSGVAQKLFSLLSEQFKQKGHHSFKIIVGKKLTVAKKFYAKMGALEVGVITIHKGEESLILSVDT